MKDQQLTTREDRALQSGNDTRSPQRFLRPAVDIFETDDALTVIADMPGADKEGLDINMEQGVLTLKATMPENSDKKYLLKEFAPTSYWRQFHISDDFDAEKADASFKDGVLTLTLAKREAVKPRHIDITFH